MPPSSPCVVPSPSWTSPIPIPSCKCSPEKIVCILQRMCPTGGSATLGKTENIIFDRENSSLAFSIRLGKIVDQQPS